jgi:Protein of unknown function (DUF664)
VPDDFPGARLVPRFSSSTASLLSGSAISCCRAPLPWRSRRRRYAAPRRAPARLCAWARPAGRACAILLAMIDDFAKEHLHDHLRWVRESLVWKLDGLSEYDIRRPLTATGTNLLGLVKHLAIWESRYFGLVFNRPFPEPLPQWDDEAAEGTDFWATEHETRDEIVGLYRRVWAHTDETINVLDIDAPGYVPWWRDEVKLFNIMVHILSDTTRHAGHADILREQLDGAIGTTARGGSLVEDNNELWKARRATIEQAARAADPANAPS